MGMYRQGRGPYGHVYRQGGRGVVCMWWCMYMYGLVV